MSQTVSSGKVVFTGNTGNGEAVTALPLTSLKRIVLDCEHNVLLAINQNEAVKSLDLQGIGTVTAAISAGILTVTLS